MDVPLLFAIFIGGAGFPISMAKRFEGGAPFVFLLCLAPLGVFGSQYLTGPDFMDMTDAVKAMGVLGVIALVVGLLVGSGIQDELNARTMMGK